MANQGDAFTADKAQGAADAARYNQDLPQLLFRFFTVAVFLVNILYLLVEFIQLAIGKIAFRVQLFDRRTGRRSDILGRQRFDAGLELLEIPTAGLGVP